MLRTGLAFLFACVALAQPIQLNVDASDITRRVIHARMTIPATPGPLRLAYPKWIPGEHAPTGPVADIVDLKITAGGRELPWRRNPAEMYIIQVDVPAGASSVDVAFNFLSPPETGGFSSGSSVTSQLGVMSWNQVLLYPAGTPSDKVEMKATLKLPDGWRFATALPIARESGNTIEFQAAPLTTMVDSPVLAGRNFRTIELSPQHYLHVAADSAAALEASRDKIEKFQKLIKETGALYTSQHYRSYHFLMTLSDHVAHFGLEHHESSDDRLPENYLTDDERFRQSAHLLPHEMTHSWNGKFRRPSGLATSDYEKPMDGELLWVYEGLTNYLGEVLAARSGLWTPQQWRERLAMTAADMDATGGRAWRPIADTATAAQLLYSSREAGGNARRGTDFYPEGSLVWLDADVLIRTESKGRKSLDDFIAAFYGGPGGKPELKPFTADDLYAALNAVQPHDWRAFFRQRIYDVAPRAPLGGITSGGWKLVFRDKASEMFSTAESLSKGADLRYSVGLQLDSEGKIRDVVERSPAASSGMAPGTQVLAFNGRQFSKTAVKAAVAASKTSTQPLEVLVKDGEYYRTFRLDYHLGERYPDLDRDASKADVLTEIVKPRS